MSTMPNVVQGLQMNQAVRELFEAQLNKGSFEFDSYIKQTKFEPQF